MKKDYLGELLVEKSAEFTVEESPAEQDKNIDPEWNCIGPANKDVLFYLELAKELIREGKEVERKIEAEGQTIELAWVDEVLHERYSAIRVLSNNCLKVQVTLFLIDNEKPIDKPVDMKVLDGYVYYKYMNLSEGLCLVREKLRTTY